MKKHEIKVGGLYTARVGGRFVTVRVDAIREEPVAYIGPYSTKTMAWRYDVTNLSTGRKTTFRSAAKFRCEAPGEVPATNLTSPALEEEGEQCPDPTPVTCAEAQDSTSPTDGSGTTGLSHAPTGASSLLASRIAAVQAASTTTKLTDEQEAILAVAKEIEAARNGGQRVLVIGAGAGSGKTFTLKQLEQVLSGNGQYTAFNSSLCAESKTKFKRCAVNTTHSLAFRAVGHKFKHRLNGARVKSYEIAQRLGIQDYTIELPEAVAPPETMPDGTTKPQVRRLKASFLAGQVTQAIRKFCQSADTEIDTKHFRRFEGIDEAGRYDNGNKVKDYLLPFAQKALADMSSEDGTLPFSHDMYVKLWELGRGDNRPVIAADYILLDEAQDTAPVMLSILQQQTHALLILVGDDCQQIYEWRGACNAMKAFPGAPRKLLSQSFRFGQSVADVANAVLAGLEEPTDLVMRGLPTIPTRVCRVAEPRCYLYRTNAGAIGKLMSAMNEGKRGHLIGGTAEVVAFCRAAQDLQQGRSTTHPELGGFSKWSEVQEYAKEDEGQDLRLLVKLIDDFKVGRIIRALENMPSEEDADLILSTAHRSKGREWASVRLGQDFRTANKLDDAERRLVYVAATRAQEELDLTECPTFCGGYDKQGGGEDGENEGKWIPGIEIHYTTPMPTVEDLTAYRAAKSAPKPAQESPTTAPESPAGPEPVLPAPNAATNAVGTGNGIPAATPTPVPAPAEPVTRDAEGNTWIKGRYGDWLVRGKPGQQGTVTVVRKNGTTSRETIRRVVWQCAIVALYEV